MPGPCYHKAAWDFTAGNHKGRPDAVRSTAGDHKGAPTLRCGAARWGGVYLRPR
jgi:hypothetical protein